MSILGAPSPPPPDQAMTVSDAIKPLAVSLNPERKPVTSGTATLLCHFKDGVIVLSGYLREAGIFHY